MYPHAPQIYLLETWDWWTVTCALCDKCVSVVLQREFSCWLEVVTILTLKNSTKCPGDTTAAWVSLLWPNVWLWFSVPAGPFAMLAIGDISSNPTAAKHVVRMASEVRKFQWEWLYPKDLQRLWLEGDVSQGRRTWNVSWQKHPRSPNVNEK